MQRDFVETTKTLLINQILPLADQHLHKDFSSREVYDRASLALMSVTDLSEVLTFLEGLEPALSPDKANEQIGLLLEKIEFDSVYQVDSEHVHISVCEPSDLARRGV